MAQVTIYLPDTVERKARRAAKACGQSVSRWVAEQVVNKLQDEWPKSVLDAAGAFPDFPDLKEIRKGYGPDVARDKLK